jgi:hypothetical protein
LQPGPSAKQFVPTQPPPSPTALSPITQQPSHSSYHPPSLAPPMPSPHLSYRRHHLLQLESSDIPAVNQRLLPLPNRRATVNRISQSPCCSDELSLIHYLLGNLCYSRCNTGFLRCRQERASPCDVSNAEPQLFSEHSHGADVGALNTFGAPVNTRAGF